MAQVTAKAGSLIDDGEIRQRVGDGADIFIDALDHDPATQRSEGSGKRDRVAVEAKLNGRG